MPASGAPIRSAEVGAPTPGRGRGGAAAAGCAGRPAGRRTWPGRASAASRSPPCLVAPRDRGDASHRDVERPWQAGNGAGSGSAGTAAATTRRGPGSRRRVSGRVCSSPRPSGQARFCPSTRRRTSRTPSSSLAVNTIWATARSSAGAGEVEDLRARRRPAACRRPAGAEEAQARRAGRCRVPASSSWSLAPLNSSSSAAVGVASTPRCTERRWRSPRRRPRRRGRPRVEPAGLAALRGDRVEQTAVVRGISRGAVSGWIEHAVATSATSERRASQGAGATSCQVGVGRLGSASSGLRRRLVGRQLDHEAGAG